jgi:hypothetical protein
LKIAFDENIPVQMVRVFEVLGKEKRLKRDGFEFVSAKDYAPKSTDSDYIRRSDVPWLTRFANAGGKVVVSGNTKMMDVPHEMEALRQHGFRVFLFERKWNDWDFFQKVSLLLYHWPAIAKKIKSRSLKAGQFWRIANHFRSDGGLYDVTPGAKKIQKTNTRAPVRKVQTGGTGSGSKLDGSGVLSPRPRRRKKLQPADQRQNSLDLIGGGSRDDPKKGIE